MTQAEAHKVYWSWWRIAATLTWLLSLWLIPYFAEQWQWIPEGTRVVPLSLLFVAGLGILFDKAAFRIGLGVVILCSVGSLYKPSSVREIVEGLDYRMRDAFFLLRGPEKPTGQVVIVDIDHKSLEEVGQWPWPRTKVATALRNIKKAGARTIGFDIVFAEPDRLSLKEWINRLNSMGIEVKLPEGLDASKGVPLAPEAVQQIVLRDWEKTLSEAGWALPEQAQNSKRARLLSEFQAFKQQEWKDGEQARAERFARAGLNYQPKPFALADDPMVSMARTSKELLYLVDHGDPEELLSQGGVAIVNNDQALAEAMADTRAVAGGLFITPTSAGSRIAAFQSVEAREESEGMIVSAGLTGAEEIFPRMRQAIDQVINIPEIQQYAYHQGMFNIVPDRSGAARFYTMIMRAPVYQEQLVLREDKQDVEGEELFNPDNYESKIVVQYNTYPSIVLEMLRAANGFDRVQPTVQEGKTGLLLRRERGFHYEGDDYGDIDRSVPSPYFTQEAFPKILPEELFIPLDFKADLQVNFRGYGGAWQPEKDLGPEYFMQYVSLSDVLYGRFDPGVFKDKYVILGSTDATLSDLVGSPFRPAFPGLEVHATMLDNLIANDILVDLGEEAVAWTFLGILVGGVLLSAAVAYGNAWIASVLTFAVLMGIPAASFAAFSYANLTLEFVYPWMCVASLLVVLILVNYFVEGRERRFVVSQFSTMVSSEVLEKVREDPDGVSLEGQRADVSVMFSDVAGFTTISERLAPNDLVHLLNDYLTPMTDIILDSHGFIDKFIGDAIMACWGVPFPDGKHAEQACLATLKQQEVLDELSKALNKQYDVDLYVRMGVSSGEVSAAMMGSKQRKNYTVMGDVVNLGARLEPACKDYGIKIMICEQTFLEANHVIEARCIDKLVVKGKSVPISVYELMGRKGELSDQDLEKIALFEKALKDHWERRWEESLKSLREIQRFDPEDPPTKVLMSRIMAYQEAPPPAEWHGEFVKTTK